MKEAMKLLGTLEEQYVGFEDYTDEIPDSTEKNSN